MTDQEFRTVYSNIYQGVQKEALQKQQIKYEEKVAHLTAENDEKRKIITGLRGELEKLKVENQSKGEVITELCEKLKIQQKRNENLNEEVEIKGKRALLAQEKCLLTGEEYELKIQKLESELKQQKAQNDANLERFGEREKSYLQEIDKLKSHIDTLGVQHDVWKSKSESRTREVKKLQTKLEKLSPDSEANQAVSYRDDVEDVCVVLGKRKKFHTTRHKSYKQCKQCKKDVSSSSERGCSYHPFPPFPYQTWSKMEDLKENVEQAKKDPQMKAYKYYSCCEKFSKTEPLGCEYAIMHRV